jgi:hypothetical protein
MIEILTIQVLAALLGMSSIAIADWLYNRGRLYQRLHSLWVSVSSTTICLPVLSWTFTMFLGDGIVIWVMVISVLSLMFFWQYHNLLKIPPVQRIRQGPFPMTSSGGSVPPPSNASG